MRFWVAITDYDWYAYLASRPHLDDVNFWQPRGCHRSVALNEGDAFVFKLRAKYGDVVVGGATFMRFDCASPALAWQAFEQSNGAATFEAMLDRIERLRHGPVDADADSIGINVLASPYFLAPTAWVGAPKDWSRNIEQGKTYDSGTGAGAELWAALGEAANKQQLAIAEPVAAYGEPALVRPRLGQGGFRLAVTEAYARRCAVTGERTLPVLQAAHIKPYSKAGPHALENGLLLRSDIHTLFDRGYITVTPDLTVRVSGRIREEWENGRDYYALDRGQLRLPLPPNPPPSRDLLQWHADTVFRG